MDSARTFSESWHRVAGQRIYLCTGVEVQRQRFRGKRWIVLRNPLSNQFFRLTPEAFDFVGRLSPHKTVEQVWHECLEYSPAECPGQEAVIQLLAQLYHANLLHYELAADAEQLFQRQRKRQQSEMGMRWLNIMFMRFPLLNPDRFLVRTLPFIKWLFTPLGFFLWLGVVIWGVKTALDHADQLVSQSEGVLAPGNLFWLYFGMALVKTIHEFGHAYFCRRFGGEVHTMGVMFMIFTPVPYVDASSSWGFRKKHQRMLVGAAGMIVELFVAACAAFVWAATGPGLVHSLMFNIMFVASISTLIFNLNPLMRFDGYYLLSDWLEIPNLNQKATGQLIYWAERYLFGVKTARNHAETRLEAFWLTFFGVTALIYRTVVFAGIIWFIADQWLLLGTLMAVFCLASWLIVPTFKLIKYLSDSPRLERTRSRAVGVVAGLAVVLVILLGVVPFPYYFRASGVVQAREWSQLITEAPGEVKEIMAVPGRPVTPGQALLRLENPQLEIQMLEARAVRSEIEARLRSAMQQDSASMAPLTRRLESADKLIERLQREQDNLIVRARNGGIWIAPGIEDLRTRWLKRGSPLGLVVNPANFDFSVTVLQEDVSRIFQEKFPPVEIRLPGQTDQVLHVKNLRVVPGEQRTLPSPALGWEGGGELAVSQKDNSGRTAAEPFFSVIGQIQPAAEVSILHGQTGKIRFRLSNEPLLKRWYRRLSQLLQQRFQF